MVISEMEKPLRVFSMALLFAGVLSVPSSPAQDDNPFHLPEGALARLGNGTVAGHSRSVVYSPDGTRLAVASSVGIWLFDTGTGDEVALLQSGHVDWFYGVSGVSFSPDGRTLASGGWDGKVWLYDVDSGQVTATLEGHTGRVYGVSFSPDGRMLAASGHDYTDGYTVRLWDVDSGQETATLDHRDWVKLVSFSPDGRILASGGDDGKVRLWDVDSGQETATLEATPLLDPYDPEDPWDGVSSVSFSPDGRILATAGVDGTMRLWDVDSGQKTATLGIHPSSVNSVSFSPDGRTLASGGWDGKVRLWDVDSGQETATLEGHRAGVNSVSFSPDGRTLASGGRDWKVRLWDVETGVPRLSLGAWGSVNSVSFSPDGRILASESYGTVGLWDVDSGQETATLQGHTRFVHSVLFSPDGKTLAIAGRDSTVRLWDVDSGQETATLEGHTSWVREVSFSPDGRILASGGLDGTVRLWDVDSGQETATLKGRWASVSSVSFSPDGRILASGGGDGKVRLWDVDSGQETATLEGHTEQVSSVSFSPDGRTLASGGWDEKVRLWDVDSGQETATLEHTAAAISMSFSPDGRLLASGSYDTVRLWDVDSGQETATLEGHRSWVHSVSFSPDGRILASGSEPNFGGLVDWVPRARVWVRLWDVDSGQEIATLQGHAGVSFSPDGRILASGGAFGILLWNMTHYVTPITEVEVTPITEVPAQTALLANYPNPFNAGTWIGYRLAAPGLVRLTIYNALGQPVRTLVNQFHVAGHYRVRWDARDRQGATVGTGIYLTRLDYPTGVQTRRLLYLK